MAEKLNLMNALVFQITYIQLKHKKSMFFSLFLLSLFLGLIFFWGGRELMLLQQTIRELVN